MKTEHFFQKQMPVRIGESQGETTFTTDDMQGERAVTLGTEDISTQNGLNKDIHFFKEKASLSCWDTRFFDPIS